MIWNHLVIEVPWKQGDMLMTRLKVEVEEWLLDQECEKPSKFPHPADDIHGPKFQDAFFVAIVGGGKEAAHVSIPRRIMFFWPSLGSLDKWNRLICHEQ